jgi:hypothetical protein
VQANMTFPPGSPDSAPFVFGSKVQFTCPVGYRWAPVTKWLQNPLNPYNESNPQRTVTVECLGTLGWTYFDVTECIPSSEYLFIEVQAVWPVLPSTPQSWGKRQIITSHYRCHMPATCGQWEHHSYMPRRPKQHTILQLDLQRQCNILVIRCWATDHNLLDVRPVLVTVQRHLFCPTSVMPQWHNNQQARFVHCLYVLRRKSTAHLSQFSTNGIGYMHFRTKVDTF